VDLASTPYTPERLTQLRALVDAHPENPFLHYSTAWMAYRGGDYDLARGEFEQAGKLWPNEPRIPNNLGNLAEMAGRNDEAEKYYRQAAALEPTWAMPHYNLGQLYTREFRYAQASEELARAASFDFDLVRNLQAEAQVRPGDPLPPAWGWLKPRTFWDALVREPVTKDDAGVPEIWRGWLEVRGTPMLWLTALCALLGFGLGLLLMLPGYALGATGAGDVKLMAAVGAMVGPAVVFTAFLCTAVTGGVFALFVAARRGRLMATLSGTRHLVVSPAEASEVIKEPARANRFAYGPAIAVGSLLAVLMR